MSPEFWVLHARFYRRSDDPRLRIDFQIGWGWIFAAVFLLSVLLVMP